MRNRYATPVATVSTIRTLCLSMAFALSAIGYSAQECTAQAQEPGKLTINIDRPGVKISPMLYGLMTEEINHSYDGGIYAELIQNRAFMDSATGPVHWKAVTTSDGSGEIHLDNDHPAGTALQRSLKLTASGGAGSKVGAANDGFWGIPVKPRTRYSTSFYAKADSTFRGTISVAIETAGGTTTLATATLPHVSIQWKLFKLNLNTEDVPASTTNRFVLYVNGTGSVNITQVSLFPPTFNNRTNGNRVDLMQKLGAMKPAFLRLPGGNYLEGNTFPERFAWKNTIHNISQRAGHQCPWGYRSSDGLGLLEFFEWCEDLKMQPILAVFAGYVLRGEHVDPGPAMQPYVDEALDEIEYATGDVSTKWGAVRALDGHVAPFKIEYVEIGNEDWFDRSGSYEGRFAQMFDAIRSRYPSLKLISTGPIKSRVPDVIDDHYYRTAADMERDVHHYDRYSRTGPKIFVGEWASTEGSPTPNLRAALGDAAWITGMERNSDLIPISCYAPLLVNVNPRASQWGTNLIGYDALNSFGSPSYYVQALFGNNRGDVVLPVQIKPQAGLKPEVAPTPHGGIGVGTWSTRAEYRDLKVTHDGKTIYTADLTQGLGGLKPGQGKWTGSDGILSQSLNETDCRATFVDPKWTDYTYTLKARKISGAEGFLVMFHVLDNQNFLWWNIGGWGNTQTVIERSADGGKREIGNISYLKVETGRWYDLRIEVTGTRIRCFADDKLINDTDDVPGHSAVDPLYSTASRDQPSGDIIVKVVNVSRDTQSLAIELPGASGLKGTAEVTVIAGQPGDVNTLADPEKVAPKKTRITGVKSGFVYAFQPFSVTLLRIPVSKK